MEGRLISKKLKRQTHLEIRFYIGDELRRTDRLNRKRLPCRSHFSLYIRASSNTNVCFSMEGRLKSEKFKKANSPKNLILHQKKANSKGSVTFENVISIGDCNTISDIFKTFAHPLNQHRFRQNLIPGVFMNRKTISVLSSLTIPKSVILKASWLHNFNVII